LRFLVTLLLISTVLSCFLPKHELETTVFKGNVEISMATEASHQHADGQCSDFESEFCHNSHCVYMFSQNVSIVSLEFPEIYAHNEIDQYYFNFNSLLLRPPIA
jgi:hypothetical protein